MGGQKAQSLRRFVIPRSTVARRRLRRSGMVGVALPNSPVALGSIELLFRTIKTIPISLTMLHHQLLGPAYWKEDYVGDFRHAPSAGADYGYLYQACTRKEALWSLRRRSDWHSSTSMTDACAGPTYSRCERVTCFRGSEHFCHRFVPFEAHRRNKAKAGILDDRKKALAQPTDH